jgi:hypothetical protein
MIIIAQAATGGSAMTKVEAGGRIASIAGTIRSRRPQHPMSAWVGVAGGPADAGGLRGRYGPGYGRSEWEDQHRRAGPDPAAIGDHGDRCPAGPVRSSCPTARSGSRRPGPAKTPPHEATSTSSRLDISITAVDRARRPARAGINAALTRAAPEKTGHFRGREIGESARLGLDRRGGWSPHRTGHRSLASAPGAPNDGLPRPRPAEGPVRCGASPVLSIRGSCGGVEIIEVSRIHP